MSTGKELYDLYADQMLAWYGVVVPSWDELPADERLLLDTIVRRGASAYLYTDIAA